MPLATHTNRVAAAETALTAPTKVVTVVEASQNTPRIITRRQIDQVKTTVGAAGQVDWWMDTGNGWRHQGSTPYPARTIAAGTPGFTACEYGEWPLPAGAKYGASIYAADEFDVSTATKDAGE